MHKAWHHFNVTKNDKLAIYYLLNATSLHQYQGNSNYAEFFHSKNETENSQSENNSSEQDKLFLENLVDRNLSELVLRKQPLNNIIEFMESKTFEDTINQVFDTEIVQTVKQFPSEWTVIQVSKNFNSMTPSSTYKEIVSFNTGIEVVVLKHSAINSYADPLIFEITKHSQSGKPPTHSLSLTFHFLFRHRNLKSK